LVEVGQLDLVVGVDPAHGDRAGLEVLQLELEDGAPVPGVVEVPIDDDLQPAALADQDHPLADLDVCDRRHPAPPADLRLHRRASGAEGPATYTRIMVAGTQWAEKATQPVRVPAWRRQNRPG